MDDSIKIRALEAQVHHLFVALGRGDVIGQARGVLLERHGTTADEALDYLIATARQQDVTVTEIAERIVHYAVLAD